MVMVIQHILWCRRKEKVVQGLHMGKEKMKKEEQERAGEPRGAMRNKKMNKEVHMKKE